jgi:hypothetical protein
MDNPDEEQNIDTLIHILVNHNAAINVTMYGGFIGKP